MAGKDLNPDNKYPTTTKGKDKRGDEQQADGAHVHPSMGTITGIKVDSNPSNTNKKTRLTSPDLWEITRLAGG